MQKRGPRLKGKSKGKPSDRPMVANEDDRPSNGDLKIDDRPSCGDHEFPDIQFDDSGEEWRGDDF